MRCHDICEMLSAYIDGMLDSSQVVQVEKHIANCPKCKLEYDDLRMTVELVRGLPEVAPPPEFHDKLHQHLASLPTPTVEDKKVSFINKLVWGKWSRTVAAAAAIFLTVGVTALWYDHYNGGILNPIFKNDVVTESQNAAGKADQSLKEDNSLKNTASSEPVTGEEKLTIAADRSLEESEARRNAPPGMGELETADNLSPDNGGPEALALAEKGKPEEEKRIQSFSIAPEQVAEDKQSPELMNKVEDPVDAVPEAEVGKSFGKSDDAAQSEANETMLDLEYTLVLKDLKEDPVQLFPIIASEYGGKLESVPQEPGQYWILNIPAGKVESFIDDLAKHGTIKDTFNNKEDLIDEFNRAQENIKTLKSQEQALLNKLGDTQNPELNKELTELRKQISIKVQILNDLSEVSQTAIVKINIE